MMVMADCASECVYEPNELWLRSREEIEIYFFDVSRRYVSGFYYWYAKE